MARTPSLTLLDPGRRAYLVQREKEAQKANARKYPIPWRGKMEELTIVRVPSTWALYNIDNGRTAAEQQAYAAKKSGSS